MDYNAPSGSTDANAPYVGKTASTIGSKVPPRAAEYPQREIVHAIKAAGLTASNNDLTQLIQAVSRGIWLGTFGGTANALTATMPGSAAGIDPVILPQFQPGMRVRGIAAYANTSATPKVTLTGIGSAGAVVQLPIVGADGSAVLPVPAWAPGQFLTFDIDNSGNARFSGAGSGSGIGYGATQATPWYRDVGGAYTYTPLLANGVVIQRGSGGSGGGANVNTGGSPAGGGAWRMDIVTGLTIGANYPISVGLGGAPIPANTYANGNNGSATSAFGFSAGGGGGGNAGNGSQALPGGAGAPKPTGAFRAYPGQAGQSTGNASPSNYALGGGSWGGIGGGAPATGSPDAAGPGAGGGGGFTTAASGRGGDGEVTIYPF